MKTRERGSARRSFCGNQSAVITFFGKVRSSVFLNLQIKCKSGTRVNASMNFRAIEVGRLAAMEPNEIMTIPLFAASIKVSNSCGKAFDFVGFTVSPPAFIMFGMKGSGSSRTTSDVITNSNDLDIKSSVEPKVPYFRYSER